MEFHGTRIFSKGVWILQNSFKSCVYMYRNSTKFGSGCVPLLWTARGQSRQYQLQDHHSRLWEQQQMAICSMPHGRAHWRLTKHAMIRPIRPFAILKWLVIEGTELFIQMLFCSHTHTHTHTHTNFRTLCRLLWGTLGWIVFGFTVWFAYCWDRCRGPIRKKYLQRPWPVSAHHGRGLSKCRCLYWGSLITAIRFRYRVVYWTNYSQFSRLGFTFHHWCFASVCRIRGSCDPLQIAVGSHKA